MYLYFYSSKECVYVCHLNFMQIIAKCTACNSVLMHDSCVCTCENLLLMSPHISLKDKITNYIKPPLQPTKTDCSILKRSMVGYQSEVTMQPNSAVENLTLTAAGNSSRADYMWEVLGSDAKEKIHMVKQGHWRKWGKNAFRNTPHNFRLGWTNQSIYFTFAVTG